MQLSAGWPVSACVCARSAASAALVERVRVSADGAVQLLCFRAAELLRGRRHLTYLMRSMTLTLCWPASFQSRGLVPHGTFTRPVCWRTPLTAVQQPRRFTARRQNLQALFCCCYQPC